MLRSLRAHLETWRPYTLWYVGLVGLAGAALAGGAGRPRPLLTAWAAPTAAWVAGHYFGDYFDRDLDAGSKPHRPIPSGRLSPRAAVASGSVCFAVLAVLAATGGRWTIAAALGGVLGIVAYSRWFKARGIAGNLVRGALGAIALLYGAAAVGHWPAAVPVLAGAFCLHDVTSNLVGTLRDVDGDRAGGYGTLPVRRGTGFAVGVVGGLYGAMFAAALGGGLLASGAGRADYLATLAVVGALGVAAIAPLVTRRAEVPAVVALRSHSVLVIERVVLAAGVVGLGMGVRWELGLGIPLAALTLWTQNLMRTRHELGPAVAAAPLRLSVKDSL